jgi:hypothetical protein
MTSEDQQLPEFLAAQRRDYGCQEEVAPGLWILFAVPAGDEATNALARSLLAGVSFAPQEGSSEDDAWNLFCVDTANRDVALFWLEDLEALATGRIRSLTPAQQQLIEELSTSKMPHRVAQQLVEQHTRGELSAGAVRTPVAVRGLLDRMHQMEPLFFAALQQLLTNHLVDMVVLLQQLIPEDVQLENEIVKAGLSRDPFLQSRQDAAADIRNVFIQFQIINPLDQQKNLAIANPYAAYLEIMRDGEQVNLPIDGANITLTHATLVKAIQAVRRNIYGGAKFETFDTQVPWMTPEIAYPFRFIKQLLATHRGLAPMDGLYMLERAVDD